MEIPLAAAHKDPSQEVFWCYSQDLSPAVSHQSTTRANFEKIWLLQWIMQGKRKSGAPARSVETRAWKHLSSISNSTNMNWKALTSVCDPSLLFVPLCQSLDWWCKTFYLSVFIPTKGAAGVTNFPITDKLSTPAPTKDAASAQHQNLFPTSNE